MSPAGADPAKVREPLARRGASMNRIESRRAHSGLWQYALFIDVNGHVDDSPLRAALAEFGESTGGVRVLGSCPVAVP